MDENGNFNLKAPKKPALKKRSAEADSLSFSNEETGYVYLAVSESMPDLVKIGMTIGDVQKRMTELGVTGALSYKAMYYCKVQNPAKIERQLHEQFDFCREEKNREFFRIDWRAVKAALEMMHAGGKTQSAMLGEVITALKMLQKESGAFVPDSAEKTGPVKADPVKMGPQTLIKWVRANRPENVRHALLNGGKPDREIRENKTALMWAAEAGYNEILNILLKTGADLNKQDKEYGWTALMHAAHNGHAETAALLVESGADVNLTTKNKLSTAVMLANQKNHAKIEKMLVKNGAHAANSKETMRRLTQLLDDSFSYLKFWQYVLESEKLPYVGNEVCRIFEGRVGWHTIWESYTTYCQMAVVKPITDKQEIKKKLSMFFPDKFTAAAGAGGGVILPSRRVCADAFAQKFRINILSTLK